MPVMPGNNSGPHLDTDLSSWEVVRIPGAGQPVRRGDSHQRQSRRRRPPVEVVDRGVPASACPCRPISRGCGGRCTAPQRRRKRSSRSGPPRCTATCGWRWTSSPGPAGGGGGVTGGGFVLWEMGAAAGRGWLSPNHNGDLVGPRTKPTATLPRDSHPWPAGGARRCEAGRGARPQAHRHRGGRAVVLWLALPLSSSVRIPFTSELAEAAVLSFQQPGLHLR